MRTFFAATLRLKILITLESLSAILAHHRHIIFGSLILPSVVTLLSAESLMGICWRELLSAPLAHPLLVLKAVEYLFPSFVPILF